MTCRTGSFCTVTWQLARLQVQLTRRISRSLGDSWASCFRVAICLCVSVAYIYARAYVRACVVGCWVAVVQVSAVASRSAINYSGRASQIEGIINLVEQRRSNLSRSERRSLSRAALIARSTIDIPWRNFRSLVESSRGKYPYFL